MYCKTCVPKVWTHKHAREKRILPVNGAVQQAAKSLTRAYRCHFKMQADPCGMVQIHNRKE